MSIDRERIVLDTITKSDLEQLRCWRNDPELRRYFREYREISETMQERWYEKISLGDDKSEVHFAIRERVSQRGVTVFETSPQMMLVGHCCLTKIDFRNRHAEFGIYIGPKERRGQGLGTDALCALVDYGFDELNLNKIWCEVYSNNSAISAYERVGFAREGILRQQQWCEGAWLDSTIMSLLASERKR